MSETGQRRLSARHIEVFRAVIIAGGLGAAARQLNVAQPSLTRMTRRIEDLLGFALFDRVKGRLVPTAEARALFSSIEHIQSQLDRLDDVVAQIRDGGGSIFRLGASPSLARQLVPRVLAKFRARFPGVKIHFDVLGLKEIVDYLALGAGECFLSMTPITHPAVETRAVWPGRLVCLLPPAHALAERRAVAPSDLVGQPLIMCEADTPHGRLVKALFEGIGATPTVSVVARFAELAIGLTGAGLGIAVVDEFTALDAASPTLIVRPLDAPPCFDVHITRARGKTPSRFGEVFEMALTEVLSTMPGMARDAMPRRHQSR